MCGGVGVALLELGEAHVCVGVAQHAVDRVVHEALDADQVDHAPVSDVVEQLVYGYPGGFAYFVGGVNLLLE
jgi:signal transduction histidine kinase